MSPRSVFRDRCAPSACSSASPSVRLCLFTPEPSPYHSSSSITTTTMMPTSGVSGCYSVAATCSYHPAALRRPYFN
ncbi:hypothetical protein LZ31DRAFT_560213 [Colletotrichum somersetense]|nr:hypothetical protein LZ31DRAFT_560213 [Colletotrichum somersetense]